VAWREVIVSLNSLGVGDLDALQRHRALSTAPLLRAAMLGVVQ